MCTPMNEGQHGALGPPSSLLETSEDEEAGQRLRTSIPRRSPLTHQLLDLQGCTRRLMPSSRRMRQMTPADKKDASYWDKRRKNNEAAKRSRKRRRLNDFMLQGQLLALSEENTKLRTEMLWLQYRFSVAKDGQPAQAPLHNLTPSALKPSLWGFRASPSSFLGDKQDLGHLLHGSRVSWTGASTSSSIGQNLHNPQSHSIYMEGSSGQPYCLQPRGHERKRTCLPSHLQPYEKTPQHPYSRAGGTEPDSTANYQVFSSKGNPSAPEQRSSSKYSPVLPRQAPPSFSASAHLPQSQFQHTLNNPSLCSSLVLPWGNPNVHLSQIYYNLPLYLPLEGRELHNHGLNPQQIFKSRADAFSTEMAHLRRYFLSESC